MKDIHGWINLFKPKGITSAHAIRHVKKLLPKATKIGHGGTLDPLACGVLPLAVGEATKTAGYAIAEQKTYQFHVLFGFSTETLDLEGKEISRTNIIPSKEALIKACEYFRGPQYQTPPQFSAKKIKGKPAYAYARSGEAVDLEPNQIDIKKFSVDEYVGAQARFTVTCSKGCYVRVLAQDVADYLGTLATVTELIRIQHGPFHVKDTILLDKQRKISYEELASFYMQPIDYVLDDIPGYPITALQARDIRQGKQIIIDEIPSVSSKRIIRLYEEGQVLRAFAECTGCVVRPKRVFNVQSMESNDVDNC